MMVPNKNECQVPALHCPSACVCPLVLGIGITCYYCTESLMIRKGLAGRLRGVRSRQKEDVHNIMCLYTYIYIYRYIGIMYTVPVLFYTCTCMYIIICVYVCVCILSYIGYTYMLRLLFSFPLKKKRFINII